MLYNIEKLHKMCNNNPVQVQRMVRMFVLSSNQQLKQLQQALNEARWNDVAFLAHRMKTAIASFDMQQALELIREIQNAPAIDNKQIVRHNVEQFVLLIQQSVVLLSAEFNIEA